MIEESLTDVFSSILFKRHLTEPLYYSQDWLDLITKLYGYPLFSLTVTNSAGRITGFLPLCYIRSSLTGPHLVALPFSDHCSLLAEDDDSANNLLDQAVRLAQQKCVRYLELRTGANDVLKKRTDFAENNLYTCWTTPLDSDPGIIWSRLPKRGLSQSRQFTARQLPAAPESCWPAILLLPPKKPKSVIRKFGAAWLRD